MKRISFWWSHIQQEVLSNLSPTMWQHWARCFTHISHLRILGLFHCINIAWKEDKQSMFMMKQPKSLSLMACIWATSGHSYAYSSELSSWKLSAPT